jgi:hypothetical protein
MVLFLLRKTRRLDARSAWRKIYKQHLYRADTQQLAGNATRKSGNVLFAGLISTSGFVSTCRKRRTYWRKNTRGIWVDVKTVAILPYN